MKNTSETLTKPVRYHQRIALPPHFGDAEVEALWEVLERSAIDEVMFLVPGVEAFSTGLATLAQGQEYADKLIPLFERLRTDGIVPSINIWWTISFSDFSSALQRDQRDVFDFGWGVRPDGHVSRVVPCPQDETWRRHTCELYAIFARLNPTRIWIDDDMHMTLKGDMHTPCFCDQCIGQMEQRTKQRFMRLSLIPIYISTLKPRITSMQYD